MTESFTIKKLQRVWMILAKVHVRGANRAGLPVGAQVLVQCFVPQIILEIALGECDELLAREGLRRVDILSCTSFDTPEDEEDAPKFVKADVLHARKTGQALTGTFFASED